MKINIGFLFIVFFFCNGVSAMRRYVDSGYEADCEDWSGLRSTRDSLGFKLPPPRLRPGIATTPDWLAFISQQGAGAAEQCSMRVHSAHDPGSLMRQCLQVGLGSLDRHVQDELFGRAKWMARWPISDDVRWRYVEHGNFNQETKEDLKSIPAIAPYVIYDEYIKNAQGKPLKAFIEALVDGQGSQMLACMFLARSDLASWRERIDTNDFQYLVVLSVLLKSGRIDINDQNEHGDTLLHRAARRGDMRAIELLLAAEADGSIKNKAGKVYKDLCSSCLIL